MERFIYIICETNYFNSFDERPNFYTSGFERDGFIHGCFENQVAFVLNNYFKDRSGLSLLKIEIKLLGALLVIEGAFNDLGPFPHIYGEVNRKAIIEITEIEG